MIEAENDVSKARMDPAAAGHLIGESLQDAVDAMAPSGASKLLQAANEDIAPLGLKIIDTRERDIKRAECVAHIVEMNIITLGRAGSKLSPRDKVAKQISFAEVLLDIKKELPVRRAAPEFDGTTASCDAIRLHDKLQYIKILNSPRFKRTVIALARESTDKL